MGMGKRAKRVVLAAALAAGLLGASASTAAAYPSITPNSHDFGPQLVGTSSSPFTFVLRVRCLEDPPNPGTCASGPEPLSPAITVSSSFTQTNDCPPTLPGDTTFGTTCNISVRFTPAALGATNGSLLTGSAFASASLIGVGVNPSLPTMPTPQTTAPTVPTAHKKCKKHRSASAAKKRCKKKH
jgi:hypothetical protein